MFYRCTKWLENMDINPKVRDLRTIKCGNTDHTAIMKSEREYNYDEIFQRVPGTRAIYEIYTSNPFFLRVLTSCSS